MSYFIPAKLSRLSRPANSLRSKTSSLQTLQGEEINGIWKLKVSDHAGLDQGKLNHWALKISPA